MEPGSQLTVTENEEGKLWVTVFRTAEDSAVTKRLKIKTQAYPITFSTDGNYLLLGLDVVRPDWDAERLSMLDIRGQKLIRSAEALSDMDNASWSTNELIIPIADPQVRFRAKSYFGSIGLDGGKRPREYRRTVSLAKLARSLLPARAPKPKLKLPVPNFRAVALDRQGKRCVVGCLSKPKGCLMSARNRTSLVPPFHHPPNIFSVALDPTGKFYATGGKSAGDVRIRNTADGKLHRGPLPHDNFISDLEFSPDGKWLAAGDYDMKVKIWDVSTGKLIAMLPQRDIVLSLAFSPDGKRLAVGTANDWNHDPQTRLWDLSTFTPIGQPMKHNHIVHNVEFSSSGKQLLTASTDFRIRVWDVRTSPSISTDMPYVYYHSAAIFSPDGSMVLAGNADGGVTGWNATTGDAVRGAMFPWSSRLTSLAITPDGSRFVAGFADGTSHLIDTREFQPL